MTEDGALAIPRGCGTRKQGGIYMEVGLSRRGRPLEDFLIDPPIKVEGGPFEEFISPIGVQAVEMFDSVAVFDWVGENYYPNVLDVLEEGRRFGFSRRVPKSFDFSLLEPGSRLMLVHKRAYVENWLEYVDAVPEWYCPKHLAPHMDAEHRRQSICLGFAWHDIEGGTPYDDDHDFELVSVAMPAFTYQAWERPSTITPVYLGGVFAALPLTRLVVVNDPVDDSHEEALEVAKRSGLDVALVEA